MSVNDLRTEIDSIDDQIVKLICERGRTALKIGQEKVKQGITVHNPDREGEVLGRVKCMIDGPITAQSIEVIYKCIINACTKVQEEVKEQK